MKYLSMAITGLIVGALAKLLYIGNDGSGWLMTMVLGVAGSLLAGFLGSLRDNEPGVKLKPAGFVWSMLGAMVLIFAAKQFNIAF